MRAAVFLDRDGVIIANRSDYVKDWSEVEFLDGAIHALCRLSESPLCIVIVTNQSAIGRGIMSYEVALGVHEKIVAEIEASGARIDASFVCPHHPDDDCDCRKPQPGMLRKAARELDLDLEASWLVGDALGDLEAARAAGVRAILVRTGRGASQLPLIPQEDRKHWPVVENLAEAVQEILKLTKVQRA